MDWKSWILGYAVLGVAAFVINLMNWPNWAYSGVFALVAVVSLARLQERTAARVISLEQTVASLRTRVHWLEAVVGEDKIDAARLKLVEDCRASIEKGETTLEKTEEASRGTWLGSFIESERELDPRTAFTPANKAAGDSVLENCTRRRLTKWPGGEI